MDDVYETGFALLADGPEAPGVRPMRIALGEVLVDGFSIPIVGMTRGIIVFYVPSELEWDMIVMHTLVLAEEDV